MGPVFDKRYGAVYLDKGQAHNNFKLAQVFWGCKIVNGNLTGGARLKGSHIRPGGQ
jgi:hypothetical protein